MKFSFFIIFGLIIVTLSSCYKDNEEYLYGELDCDTTNVSFSADILPIINASCATTGCHVAGGSGNGTFENYTQIKDKVDNGSMLERVVVLKDMPPSPLTDCQILHFQQWLNEGAPNN
jgi:hypothetical protein